MKDLIGVSTICLVGLWFVIITLPTPEDGLKERREACKGRGHAVIINGQFDGHCTGDKQSAGNMYYPKGGPVPMRPIREYNDDWIIGK